MTTANEFIKKINRKLNSEKKNEFPLISIFSGILGLDIGLERAGFKTKLALDFDKDCRDVIENNRNKLGNFPYLVEDINKLSAEEILSKCNLNPGETAILAGGPPCQPFSKSGLRKGVDDENKGQLFKRYINYLQIIKPKAFILENVRGLYSSNKGEDFKLIIKHFDETGYTIYWKILDAANYGVPQFRQRMFIIGFKDRIKFNFPEETHGDSRELNEKLFSDKLPFLTVGDAINDLAETANAPKLSGKYSHLLDEIPEGMNYSYYTAERGYPKPVFGWRTKFWYFLLKTDRAKPSLTIQAYPGNNTGPFHWKNRRMAIDEIKRIQSLPDWLVINKSYMTAHRLIGNAVPSMLAEILGHSIKNALENNEIISENDYLSIRSENLTNGHVVKSGRGSGKGKPRQISQILADESVANTA